MIPSEKRKKTTQKTECVFYLQQAELLGPEVQGGQKCLEVSLLPPQGEGLLSVQSKWGRRIGQHDADVAQQLPIELKGKKQPNKKQTEMKPR